MKSLLLTFVLLLTFACSDDDGNSTTEPQSITPQLVGKGYLGSSTNFTVENRVITTNAQWQDLLVQMEEAREGITQNFVETTINFSEYQIVAAYITGSSGTTIDITAVVENENNITITLENLRKGATQDVTHPFHIIKIPRSSKPIVFDDLTDRDN
jgi:hypothetical protein